MNNIWSSIVYTVYNLVPFSLNLIKHWHTVRWDTASHGTQLCCTLSLRSRCHQSQVLRLWLCEFPQFLGKHRIVSSCTYSIKFLWNLYELLWIYVLHENPVQVFCSNVWSNTTFVLQKSPLILMGMPYQHIWQLFLMTHYESLRCLDLDHSRFQAILTAQTVWCPSVMTRGVGDAERALDTLNYSSIRGRSRLRQKGWGLSRLNIYQLGEFGTILLWSFNVIEFLCLWVWAYKSFQVPHYVEPTSLDEHPVFFLSFLAVPLPCPRL